MKTIQSTAVAARAAIIPLALLALCSALMSGCQGPQPAAEPTTAEQNQLRMDKRDDNK